MLCELPYIDDYIRYDLPSRLKHVGLAAELYGVLENVMIFQKTSKFKQKSRIH